MAKETIKAIRQAELNALETEKRITEERRLIIHLAEEQASRIVEEMTKNAREQANKAMEETMVQGDEIIKKALAEVNQEIEGLGMLIREKETVADRLILSELIG